MSKNRFVVITPTFNCKEKIKRTIWSVVGQTYENWKMVIIDDMSSDGTGDYIRTFLKTHNLSDKITVKSRDEKYGETRNTYEECKLLSNEDIVIRLDAGDFITDLACFDFLNIIYTNHDPAVVWTAHRWAFTDQNISGPIDPTISVYDQPWRSSHLKTFRSLDFKGINILNFKDDEENWIMIGCDQAVFLPMMERARRKGRKLIFFPRVMYHYDINLEDPELFTKDRSIEQKQSAERTRSRGYIE